MVLCHPTECAKRLGGRDIREEQRLWPGGGCGRDLPRTDSKPLTFCSAWISLVAARRFPRLSIVQLSDASLLLTLLVPSPAFGSFQVG